MDLTVASLQHLNRPAAGQDIPTFRQVGLFRDHTCGMCIFSHSNTSRRSAIHPFSIKGTADVYICQLWAAKSLVSCLWREVFRSLAYGDSLRALGKALAVSQHFHKSQPLPTNLRENGPELPLAKSKNPCVRTLSLHIWSSKGTGFLKWHEFRTTTNYSVVLNLVQLCKIQCATIASGRFMIYGGLNFNYPIYHSCGTRLQTYLFGSTLICFQFPGPDLNSSIRILSL